MEDEADAYDGEDHGVGFGELDGDTGAEIGEDLCCHFADVLERCASEEGEADDYEGEGDEDVGDAHEAVEAHEGVVGPNAFDGFVSDEECAMVSSP